MQYLTPFLSLFIVIHHHLLQMGTVYLAPCSLLSNPILAVGSTGTVKPALLCGVDPFLDKSHVLPFPPKNKRRRGGLVGPGASRWTAMPR